MHILLSHFTFLISINPNNYLFLREWYHRLTIKYLECVNMQMKINLRLKFARLKSQS